MKQALPAVQHLRIYALTEVVKIGLEEVTHAVKFIVFMTFPVFKQLARLIRLLVYRCRLALPDEVDAPAVNVQMRVMMQHRIQQYPAICMR